MCHSDFTANYEYFKKVQLQYITQIYLEHFIYLSNVHFILKKNHRLKKSESFNIATVSCDKTYK